jgi:hypothetical protein
LGCRLRSARSNDSPLFAELQERCGAIPENRSRSASTYSCPDHSS